MCGSKSGASGKSIQIDSESGGTMVLLFIKQLLSIDGSDVGCREMGK